MKLLLDLLDAEGSVLAQLSVAADYTPGDTIELGNGLTLALGAGTLGLGDEFTLDVAYDAGGVEATATADTSTSAAASAPAAAIGGSYDSSNGSQTLTLRVTQGGAVGADSLLIDVLDAEGSLLEQLSVGADYEAGTALSLANGLTLSLAAGRVGAGDELTVDVTATEEVDTAAAFDGGGGDPPAWLLGATVSDGSFTLNGMQIDVYASDSLDSVLARINDAEAGVTAAFDTGGRVVLTQTASGSAADILAGDDTSGFLAAVGLADATTVAGGGTAFRRIALAGGGAGGARKRHIDGQRPNDRRGRRGGLARGHHRSTARRRRHARVRRGSRAVRTTGPRRARAGRRRHGVLRRSGPGTGAYADRRAAEGFANPDKVKAVLRDLAGDWNQSVKGGFEGTAATHADRLNTTLRTAFTRQFSSAGLATGGNTLRTDFGLSFRFLPDGALEIRSRRGRTRSGDARRRTAHPGPPDRHRRAGRSAGGAGRGPAADGRRCERRARRARAFGAGCVRVGRPDPATCPGDRAGAFHSLRSRTRSR